MMNSEILEWLAMEHIRRPVSPTVRRLASSTLAAMGSTGIHAVQPDGSVRSVEFGPDEKSSVELLESPIITLTGCAQVS